MSNQPQKAQAMIFRYDHISRYPRVFRSVTGLTPPEFNELVTDVGPVLTRVLREPLHRSNRQRAIGGGNQYDRVPRDQILLTVVWLRIYPIHEVLAYLFGVSDSTVSRIIARVLPLLERAGRDTFRLPDPGRKHRRTLDTLMADFPEAIVVIDSFEQRVQRPKNRKDADTYYSGKKKQHTLKSQIAVNARTGEIVAISQSVCGPMADLTLLKESHLLDHLPPGVGAIGDLAYIGIADLHQEGLAGAPRRTPRKKERSPEDVAYNTEFAKNRIIVEHGIGRMRRYQSVTQTDREHRRRHEARTGAVAGLANRQIARHPRVIH